MASNIILEKSIEELELNNNILKKLKSYNLLKIKDLWNLKRKDLKQLGFSDNEIGQIIVKLQLHAIDLNKKIY